MTRPEPPSELLDIAAKVDARIQGVLDEQSEHWHQRDPRLGEAVDELARMMTSGGKRLRSAFCYWAWRGYYDADQLDTPDDGDPEDLILNMGAAFEFLQTFALIHDDIMDDSATRRGVPTIHVTNAERVRSEGWKGEPRRYGDGIGILIGDLGHVYADQLTSGISPRARQIWDELRIELNLGQYLDMRSAASGQLDFVTAQQVATFKTALYTIVRPLQIGVCLHQPADISLLEQLDRFGRPLGQAFQLRDDALGLLSSEGALGKPVGDDLREGKPTIMLAHARAKANPAEAELLAKVGCGSLTGDDVAELVGVFESTGALAENEKLIASLVTEAHSVLESLPLKNEGRKALAVLADYVAARTY